MAPDLLKIIISKIFKNVLKIRKDLISPKNCSVRRISKKLLLRGFFLPEVTVGSRENKGMHP